MEVMVTLAFGQKDQVMGVPLIAARFGQGPEIVGQGMLGRSLAAVFRGRVVAEMVETVPVFWGDILFRIMMLGLFKAIFMARQEIRVPAPESEGLGLPGLDIEHGHRIVQVINLFFQARQLDLFQFICRRRDVLERAAAEIIRALLGDFLDSQLHEHAALNIRHRFLFVGSDDFFDEIGNDVDNRAFLRIQVVFALFQAVNAL